MRIRRYARFSLCLGIASGLIALTQVHPAPAVAAKKEGNQKTVKKTDQVKVDDKVPARPAVAATPLSRTLAASSKVDKFIEAGYAKGKVKPNRLTSDELFLRRIYLDIVGRIPTLKEATEFLDSNDNTKRSQLIDRLLDSEGYVSHNFNYWADLLRLQSRMRYVPAQPYLDFVKSSLRENKPYDQFVRELVTAEGYTWDNGAAGYYLRDTGMPLDNMSNTAQVFLGTQLVCAQCHNHPYDSWTQRQYYQLAAFTYGVETRDRRNGKYMELRQMRRDEKLDREVMRSANRILLPLAYRVNESTRKLQLPHDYQYDDAKPKSKIDPSTIFGEQVEVSPGDSPKEIYAKWMTSAKNPRFTAVIANRLWKRVMGVGLIEPVDDFKDGVDASHPELMQFLTDQMVALKFDMKQYLRILYNSKTYQREVATEEVDPDKAYNFAGPVLRRLSAEQLWDSFVSLTIQDIDERSGYVRGDNYLSGQELVDKNMPEILKMAEAEAKRRTMQIKFVESTRDLQKDLRVATRVNDKDKVNALRTKMNDIRKQVYGAKGEMMMRRRRTNQRTRETDPRWAGISREVVRASEIDSPARPGHFLRQFGQSDRETIENANTEATVPQVLTLLNGPMFGQLFNRGSQLAKELGRASQPQEKIDVLFLSILSRRATDRESKIALAQIESDGRVAYMDIAWALINTRQFVFVQ